jgi:hypothetical protein
MRKRIVWICIFAAASASGALAQDGNVFYQSSGGINVTARAGRSITPVTGAPYSATITNEMTQTLDDGTHIVQKTNGSVARDSEGRMRQDAPLPMIGNLAAANAPHIVFLQDPVAQVSYMLDLTDKIAQKMTVPPPASAGAMVAGTEGPGPVFVMRTQNGVSMANTGQMPPLPPPLPPLAIQKAIGSDDPAQVTNEDLGSQTMEGVTVTGTRATHVIPAGQIGNDAPISIVTEVWTSPELKTVVYSKRSDPRMGVQTFQLTNIVQAEPDATLFTVPPDFKEVDGPQPIMYRTNQ